VTIEQNWPFIILSRYQCNMRHMDPWQGKSARQSCTPSRKRHDPAYSANTGAKQLWLTAAMCKPSSLLASRAG